MYTIEEIKEYISVLEASTLSVLEVQKDDGSKIRLERATQVNPYVAPAPVMPQMAPVMAPPVAPVAVAAPAVAETAPAKASEGKTINSPIVGVFYVAPSPDSEPYVSAGKKVKTGDTVCIVEAMKCMNEIAAEFDCEIVEVLVNDGELVEYGQPLFKIR